jgi:hypothetical protein
MDEPRSRNREAPRELAVRNNDRAAQITAHDLPVLPESNPSAIVVRCSDPRFQGAFDQFIEQELGLARGQSIPIVVGGGAGVLGHPEQLPKEFKFLKERLEYCCRRYPSIHRIVLINHEGCRYYEWVQAKTLGLLGSHFGTGPDEPLEDLSSVALHVAPLAARLGCTVEFYYAKFTDPDRGQIEIARGF